MPEPTTYKPLDLPPPHIEIEETFDRRDTVLNELYSGELCVIIPFSHLLYHEAEFSLAPRYKRNFSALKQWTAEDGTPMELEYSYAVYRDVAGLKLRLFSTGREYRVEDRRPLTEVGFFDASLVECVEAGRGDEPWTEDEVTTPTQSLYDYNRS